MIVRKPVGWIPAIVDLFLGALERAAGNGSGRALVEIQVGLRKYLIDSLVCPLELGFSRCRGHQYNYEYNE